MCPGLGPSRVWSAHGKVWLLSTREDGSPLHHPPTSSPSGFSVPPCSATITRAAPLFLIKILTKHFDSTCVCAYIPPRCPPNAWRSEEKFLTASVSDWQPAASRWSLWSPSPHCCGPPWPGSPTPSPVWSVWSCCINNAARPERFPPPVIPTEPGHHENLEAEELCLSDLRSPRLVPV